MGFDAAGFKDLSSLVAALRPTDLQAMGLAIDSARTPMAESRVVAHHRFDIAGLAETPFAFQAAVVAHRRGRFAFDRLERDFLPPLPAWLPPGVQPASLRLRREPELVRAPLMWPFRLDGSVADFEATTAPRWWSHGLIHAMVGFGYWPSMTAAQVVSMARLSEALASWLWYHLGELGNAWCPLHDVLHFDRTPDCGPCRQLHAETGRRAIRAERIESPAGEAVALTALDMLRYEVAAFESGVHGGQLSVSAANYLDMGEACDWALLHLGRLHSPANARFVQSCLQPGLDYADSIGQFESRCLAVVRDLLTPALPGVDSKELRGVRVLQDVGARLCHLAALDGDPTGGCGAAVSAVCDAITSLREGEGEVESTLARALEQVAADPDVQRACGHAQPAVRILALGYAPVSKPVADASVVHRKQACLARVRLASAPVARGLQRVPEVVTSVITGVRCSDLGVELAAALHACERSESVSAAEARLVRWLLQVASPWTIEERLTRTRTLWWYRLAALALPEPAQWPRYKLELNPHLAAAHCPFEPAWLDAMLKGQADGAGPVVSADEEAAALVGPGRHGPLLLALTPQRQELVAEVVRNPRLDGWKASDLSVTGRVGQAVREGLLIVLPV